MERTSHSPDPTTAQPDRVAFYGAAWCRDCRRSKALLDRLEVPYSLVDVEHEPGGAEAARALSGRTRIPVIQFPDGSIAVEPSDRELLTKLESLRLVGGEEASGAASAGPASTERR